MSLGKLLVEPILQLVGISLVVLLTVRRHEKSRRTAIAIAVTLLTLLLVLSVPVISLALQESVELPPTSDQFPPEIIDVPAGGLAYKSSAISVPSHDSVARVLGAVEWWRQYPHARIVMSGGAIDDEQGAAEQTASMAELAVRLGVPRSQIFVESRSRNTRQHPIELRRFPFATAESKVGVCTSSWHLRRTLYSFRRQFRFVEGHAAPENPSTQSLAERWFPSNSGLGTSTRMLDEWIGLCWYRLRDLAGR